MVTAPEQPDTSEQTVSNSSSSITSDDDAQKIVYTFIDIMPTGAPYIGDASTLPYLNHTQEKPPEWALPLIGKYMQRSLDK